MKKILISGANSYIGSAFRQWISRKSSQYCVDTISVRDEKWKTENFGDYDVIYHTAAIVHVKEKNKKRYNEVNRDLAVEVAQKAKSEGVKQFIFLSTMGVYGKEIGYITENTLPNPRTYYARSKYEAEIILGEMCDSNFRVAILRPPIVYGHGCKGNYSRLSNMITTLPLFPKINNQRSMIYIDNLSCFVQRIIDTNAQGIFFPQNKEYVRTAELAQLIANASDKTILITALLNPAVTIGNALFENFRKVFGSLVYDKRLLGGPGTMLNGEVITYETMPFKDTIMYTEGKEQTNEQ